MTALVIAVSTVLAAVAYRTELLGHRARARAARLAARGLGSAETAGLASRTGATGTARPSGPWDTPDRAPSVSWRTPGVLAPAIVAGAAAVTVLGGPRALAGAVLAAALGPVVARRRSRTDVRRRRRSQLPGALERLATALRAGSSVPTALGAAGAGLPAPIGPELADLGRQADGGRAVVEVLDEWAAHHDDAGTRLAASALVMATVVGAAPGRAVDGVAATLRERLDLSDERRALGSQARMSTLVLSVAPLGFALLLGATDGASSRFLLGTPAGWACLVVGLGLDAAGAWWMARLTRGGEP